MFLNIILDLYFLGEYEMKLLIVDDEELTRTGVISSVAWSSIGIDEVLQADDGLNGLELAREAKPEIILCDVRMPRMDGITMLERLEELLPDSVPIFMSGYSDKEYLKAAIKLKAVNYIEKPLNSDEIRAAVLEAHDLYIQRQYSHQGADLLSKDTASKLAKELTVPYGNNRQKIDEYSKELPFTLQPGTNFTTFIVKLDSSSELAAHTIREISMALDSFLKNYHMHQLFVQKRALHLVYFLCSPNRPVSGVLKDIGAFLTKHFSIYGKFYITCGETVTGISKAYQSYASAVILLQSSFFFPTGTFLFSHSSEDDAYQPSIPSNPENEFSAHLAGRDQDSCKKLLDTLFSVFHKNMSLLQNQVKDIYYKMFLALEDARKQQAVTASLSKNEENIADTMEHSFSLEELHQKLLDKTDDFFRDLQNSTGENPTIFLIKDYISKNYMNETLSVKDISAHVFLSTSYVCTFFKNETGKTLNQYLTEYRMERAKQLLADSRYKISDVSSKVGYSDGNYFGKSFKKYSGFSPSEYREKMIR